MTQVDLAARAEVSESTIINQETKDQIPTPDNLERIITALAIDEHDARRIKLDALRIIYRLDDKPPAPVLPHQLDRLIRQYVAMNEDDRRALLQHVEMLSVWGDARLAAASTRPTRRRIG
jgi:transcriptional regulator with XRE-family HTH domain